MSALTPLGWLGLSVLSLFVMLGAGAMTALIITWIRRFRLRRSGKRQP